MGRGALSRIVRTVELWDGDLDQANAIAHALEGLGLELVRPEDRSAPMDHESAGAWMRLEALLLAMIARLDLSSPEGRFHARRIEHVRVELRARGPLSRPRRLT